MIRQASSPGNNLSPGTQKRFTLSCNRFCGISTIGSRRKRHRCFCSMTDDPPVVQRLSRSDSMEVFRRIADLHAQQIHGGVLPLLGQSFLATLYREIAKSKWGTLHQAEQNGRALGFIAGTVDIWRCAFG